MGNNNIGVEYKQDMPNHSGFMSEEELRRKDNESAKDWIRSLSEPDGIIIPTGECDPITNLPIFKTVMFDKKT